MHSLIQFAPLKVKSKFYRNTYLLKGFKMMLIINIKLNGDLLVHVGFAESYRSDQQNETQSAYVGNQSFPLFTVSFVKSATSEIRNKSVVVVTENSDYNRITSMSCLKKVIDTLESECGKSFINVVLWSDGMGAQFRSRFIYNNELEQCS